MDLDNSIVHELNHLYELSLIKANKEEHQEICGWDVLYENFTKELNNNYNEKRDYELLTQDILKKVLENDKFVLMPKDKMAHIRILTS